MRHSPKAHRPELDHLVVALLRAHRYRLALTACQAMRSDASLDKGAVWLRQARAHEGLGETDEAFELIQRAFRVMPGNREVALALERLNDMLTSSSLGPKESSSQHAASTAAPAGVAPDDDVDRGQDATQPDDGVPGSAAISKTNKMRRGVKQMLSQVPNSGPAAPVTAPRSRRHEPAPASDAGWIKGQHIHTFVLSPALLQRQGTSARELVVCLQAQCCGTFFPRRTFPWLHQKIIDMGHSACPPPPPGSTLHQARLQDRATGPTAGAEPLHRHAPERRSPGQVCWCRRCKSIAFD